MRAEPQNIQAWARGAVGEEKVGRSLDALVDRGARVLHDRRVPHSVANIDHIVVGPAGVFVIDAKRYTGHLRLRLEGGLLRPRTETLTVGRRDCSKLVVGVVRQTELVRAALCADGLIEGAATQVRGMLCFVDADWPLTGSFMVGGVDVLSPGKIASRVFASPTTSTDQIACDHACLASAFASA